MCFSIEVAAPNVFMGFNCFFVSDESCNEIRTEDHQFKVCPTTFTMAQVTFTCCEGVAFVLIRILTSLQLELVKFSNV